MKKKSTDLHEEDIAGSLENIRNLADIGIYLIEQKKSPWIPTLLEYIFAHSQRLIDEYVVKEGK